MEEKKYPVYSPTKEEKELIGKVQTRFSAMKTARSTVDKNWANYHKMIEAVLVPYKDGRSSSNVPLSSALIELFVAETLKLETNFEFRGETGEYKTQAKALEYVRNYDWRKNNRKRVFNEQEYIAAWFGTSVIYTGFESYTKTQKDMIVWDDLEIQRKDNPIKKERIIVEGVDLRRVYFDDQALRDIEEANDAILIQWMSYDKFKEITKSKVFKNVDSVAPRSFSSDDDKYATNEEKWKTGDFVKLIHYWNLATDTYCIIANDVLVREHPIMSTLNGEKALPFTIRVLGKKSNSLYGRGLCEAVMMFASEINNFREMLMDAIKRSNSQVLAIWSWLTFNWSTFSYDNQILEFDGNFTNNFQQISWTPPNQALLNQMENLYKDIAVYVGIDIQNIIWQASQTAFQTEVQREASQKRVNVWLYNRDLAYERFANLYKDLLQTFFPSKTADGLYKVIEIEWEELKWEWKNQKFRNKKWKSTFQVTPEILRGDFFIDVHTNINAPTIWVVDKQLKMDYLQSIWNIAQSIAWAKQAWIDIEEYIDIKDNMRELAREYGLDTNSGVNDDVKDGIEEVNKLLKSMMPVSTNQQAWPNTLWSQPMNSNTEMPWSEQIWPPVM